MSRRFDSKTAQTRRTALLTAVALAAFLALWSWYRHDPYMEVHPAVFFIPAAGLAVMLCAGFLRWPAFWRFVIALLLVSEIVVWDLHFVPFYAGGRVRKIAPPHIGETQTIVANNERGASVRPNLDMLYLKPVINGYDPLYLNRVRQAICSPRGENAVYTTLHLDNIIVENPRSSLLLKRSFWLSRQYVDGPLPPKTQLFPVATTVFLENPGDLIVPEAEAATLSRSGVSGEAERVDIADASALAGLHKAGAANKMSLRLPPFHPGGVHSVLCLRYASSNGAYLDLRFNDPVKNVATKGARQRISPTRSGFGLLEIPLPDAETVLATLEWTAPAGAVVFTEAYALLDRADENSLITVVSRTANTADLDITALSGPRILSFLDADYPGWKAWVDGEATPVLRADDVFKAVALPAGAHHVRFAFRPWRVYAGMAISLLTVTVTLALLAFRRPKNEPIPEN